MKYNVYGKWLDSHMFHLVRYVVRYITNSMEQSLS
jgi:hypothetical protein